VHELKTGRRDRKKQQTREALTRAALRLVDERGIDRVTVEEIAEAADVSPRTFFNYFATKDEALIGDQFEDDHETRERFLAIGRSVPTTRAMLTALGPVVEAVQQDRELWLLRLRVAAANPSLLASLISRASMAERSSAKDIAERLGVDPDSPYPLLAAALTGAAMRASMMRWAESGGEESLPELVQEAFGVLAAGLTDPETEEGS
jgi:AcrR family transcriptional regulator